MDSAYLFAYGTLRRRAAHPMSRVLVRHARPAGRARFAGLLFDVGPYPAAIPDRSGRRWVLGELYRLTDAGRLFPVLDRYEGCAGADSGAGDYRRELREVIGEDGEHRRAWIYLYNLPIGNLPRIASGDFLMRRRKGPA